MHFCTLPDSVLFFFVFFSMWCMCETENSHFLSPAHKTLPDCRHCLNGKDVGYAALFHPHIYFSSSESSHMERKCQHLNSSNSFHLGDIQMSRSDADEMRIFVLTIFIFFSSPFLLNELIYVFRKNCVCLSLDALN